MKDLVIRAREYAEIAHGGQMYGEDPYIKHLQDVHDALVDFGVTDIRALAAGYLHDVVEDTDVSIQDVQCEFGFLVADIVWFCTDEEGESRKERKSATYKKWQALISSHPKGHYDLHRTVKVVDRICNLRDCPPGLLKMYRKEHAEFKDAIGPHPLLIEAEVLLGLQEA